MTAPEPEPVTAAGAGQVALARPGSRVLLAGTGRHPDGSPLPAVPQAGASLTDLASVLREQAGVPAANLRLLLDPPSPLEFGRAVARAAAEATDALLLYYTGHGLVGRDDALYLATCATSDLTDDLPYSALPYAALRQAAATCRARTIAVILDCCFSGRAELPGGPSVFDAAFEQTPVRGGFLLAAAAREELGLAQPGAAHTAFTGALVSLLRDGDEAALEYLTLDDIYQHLSRVLPATGAPRPRRQSSDHAGDLVVARNAAFRSRPAPADRSAGARGAEDADPAAPGGVAVRQGHCPYRGLPPYGPEDARYFFGRAATTAQIIRRIVDDGGLIAVVGASGCGKTSLLRAGVVPALEALPPGWTVATMTPGTDPARVGGERIAALSAHRPAVLLVDQFEELFTAGVTEAEQDRFVRDLAAAAAGPVTVVIAIRADFYQACTRYPLLIAALEGRQIVVGPMTPRELRTVIDAPARAVGQDLEEGLADTLLREAGERSHGAPAAVLPLLSHALRETWQRSANLLTLAAYRATGGIDGAVARTAEDAYASVAAADRPALRALLLRLVSLGDGTEDTRRRLPLADLADGEHATRRVLDTLVKARLVTVDADNAEIAHEALLYAWPRLRAWIEEDRAALLVRQHLEDAARAWDQSGHRDTDLYRGTRLEAADRAAREQPDMLTSPAREFLDRSLLVRRQERREARRRAVRLRAAVSAVCVLLLVAAAAGGFSVVQHRQAARNAAMVNSAGLAAAAAEADGTGPSLAGQFAVAAYRSAPTEQAATELYNVLGTSFDRVVGSMPDAVAQVATQPDGPLGAAIDAAGTLRVWDLTNPAAPVLDATVPASTEAIAFSPRGGLLAGPCRLPVNGLCLWTLADPRRPAVAARLPLPAAVQHAKTGVSSMAISPDGTLLAAADPAAGETAVWSIARPARPRLLAELPNPTSRPPAALAGVAFAPRSGLLAETVLGGRTRLWRVAPPRAPALVTSIGTGYASVAFDPTGTLLAAAGDDNVGLWNVGDPAHPMRVSVNADAGPLSAAVSTAISPDGTEMAYSLADTADPGGMLCTLSLSAADLSSGLASPACTTTDFRIRSVAYANGGALFSGGLDGQVRLWRSALPRADAAAVSSDPSSWAVSPDGRTMVAPVENAGTRLPQLGIWDIAAPGGPVLDAPLPVTAQSAAYVSPTVLVIAANDGAVRLWDLRDTRHPVQGAALGTAVYSSPVAPVHVAGSLVAVQDVDGRLRLWHVTGAHSAAAAGSVPDSGAAPGYAGITANGRAAVVFTAAGITWWDITDPARPVRAGVTRPGHMGQGAGLGAGGMFAAEGGSGARGEGTDLYVFDVSGGRPRTQAKVATPAGDEIDISADGRLLAATGPGNNTVLLWNITDPRHPSQLAALPTLQNAAGIAFDPGGNQLAVWNNGAVQLWDITHPDAPSLQATVVPPGLQPLVSDAAYLPAGPPRLLVATDTSVYVFDAEPGHLADGLCAYTGDSMTLPQWREYAPRIPYRPPCQ